MTLLDSDAHDSDSSLDCCVTGSDRVGLGDIIYGAIRESGASDVPLGSLLSVLAAKGSIPCVYNGKNYAVKFDTSGKTPQVEVVDVSADASWVVSLNGFPFKAMYRGVNLSFSANEGGLRTISCDIRGGVAGTLMSLLNKSGVSFDGPVTVDRVSNLVGSRIFDPERKSRVLKITKI